MKLTEAVLLCIVLATVLLCVSCASNGWENAGVVGCAGAPDCAPTTAPEPGKGEGTGQRGADARAAERLPEELSLRDAFVMALEMNKDVRVTSLRADADRQRIMGARGEFDAELFAEASRGRSDVPGGGVPLTRDRTAEGEANVGVRKRFTSGTGLELSAGSDYARDLDGTALLDPTYDSDLVLSLTQDLLRDLGPRVNRTFIVVARNNWRISLERLRGQMIDTLFEVERAYWNLYFAQRDLEVRRKQLGRARQLVERAEAYVRVGTSPPLDITRARSDAARQRVNILRAENGVARARHRLLRLLGILGEESAGARFRLADEPQVAPMAVKLGDALATARQNRPDYRQALLDIENADLRADHARNQRLPTLQVFGEYDLAGLDDGFRGSAARVAHGDHGRWLMGLRFEWPFPNRAARSDYEVARLRRRIARVGQQRLHEEIAREVSDALSDLETAEGRVESARQARELAETLLEAEEKSFSLGQSDSKDVLDAQQAVAVAERDEARARADFATAVANLLRAQGTLLQARGVTFARDAEKSGGE